MSITMSFEAKKNVPLTQQENDGCAAIVERYLQEYPYNKEYENFMVLPPDYDLDIVYSCFTKFPTEECPESFFEIANYWLKCLTEITHVLADCQCSVSFEGVELIFENDTGWRFLMQEEYEQRY